MLNETELKALQNQISKHALALRKLDDRYIAGQYAIVALALAGAIRTEFPTDPA